MYVYVNLFLLSLLTSSGYENTKSMLGICMSFGPVYIKNILSPFLLILNLFHLTMTLGAQTFKGVELELVRGEKFFFGLRAPRENSPLPPERFFSLLGMIFAPLLAYFSIFFLKSLEWPSLQEGGGPSPLS